MRLGYKFALVCLAFLAACTPINIATVQEQIYPSPVAFVNAVTPPVIKPTAIPTTIVNTPVPVTPTPIAKRIAQDTSATIGLWAQNIVINIPMTMTLDIGVGNALLPLKKINPQVLMFASTPVNVGFETNFTDTAKTNPNFLLFDKDKKIVFSNDTKLPLINIRDTDVRLSLAENAVQSVKSNGYDGILLEGLGVDLIRTTNTPIFTGTKEFTEQQRRDAVEGLLRAMRSRLSDKQMIVSGYAWRDGTSFLTRVDEARALADIADGVMMNEFLRVPISKTTEFRTETNWKRDVDAFASLSQGDRIVLLRTAFQNINPTPDENQLRQWMNYTVASYLLGKNGKYTYLWFDVPNRPDLWNDAIFSAPLGLPQEAYMKLSTGIYKRAFSGGVVLVNPTSESKKADLDQEYKSLMGISSKTISMTANTGVVLLKSLP
jgi:hypothetical protein